MIKKELFNILAVHTPDPIQLASANGGAFYGPSVKNLYAKTGLLYVEVAGFVSTAGSPVYTGFGPEIWCSHNNYIWFKNTSLPTTSTALCSAYALDNLGSHIRFKYVGSNACNKVRCTLELNNEII